MKTTGRWGETALGSLVVLGLMVVLCPPARAETRVEIRAVAGIGYSVDWVSIDYRDAAGQSQRIRRDQDIPLGQEASFTIPDGATNILLEAKPRASLRSTRIFNNLNLESERGHCFELRGTVNHPTYTRVNCGWVPSGRISVFDTELHQAVGLKRVMVEVHNRAGTSTIGTAYTDDSGAFRLSRSVSGPVRYKVVFQDRAGLRVKYGANSHPQSVTFSAMERRLNHVFQRTDRQNWYWASIYNACQFYKDYAAQDGLPFKRDAQICGYYETGISRTLMTGIQDVVFRLYNDDSGDLFSTVMHELSHVTHATVDRAGYASFVGSWGLVNSLRAAYGESWACGPQAIYWSRRYDPGNELAHYQREPLADYTYRPWTVNGEHLYIHPIVVDLMDRINQRLRTSGGPPGSELPIDRVSGYTLQHIATALRGAHDLDDWKNNLKRVSNPTSVYLDEYFDQYFEDRPVAGGGNTIIRLKAVTGIGYAVDWVEVTYDDATGTSRSIRRDRNIALGQEATITVPGGATNIRIEAKPLASLGRTRIFDNLNLTSGQSHCFHLTGTVNRPRYSRVDCARF